MIFTRTDSQPSASRRLARPVIGALLLCLVLLVGASARAEAVQTETAEWTIMLYMCGTDLESSHSLATYNLNEIASMWFPQQIMVQTGDTLRMTEWPADRVHLVVQTGGARRWHGLEPDEEGRTLGVDIPVDRLSRYSFDLVYSPDDYGYVPSITLVDEQPLASMGDPETLSGFVQWAAQTCPAKKYALVLWDHGGGSRTGLFVDELFDKDILYLSELGQALNDGGVHLELVAFDACLMCSLETARTIAPYANYMVASEEVTASSGSAYSEWLLEVYRNPGCDGAEVGVEFCDATQRKYVERGAALEEAQLTYSVIDLSRIGAVSEAFDRMFDFAGLLYEQAPARFSMFNTFLSESEKYGLGGADMIDLGSFLYSESSLSLVDPDCRNALASALEDAVYYTVKGSARSASKGLSFCFAPDMSPDEMDAFALNCRSASYLALLDAVNADWEAADWVYEKARRLTPIEDLDTYRIEWEITELDGLPALRFTRLGASLLDCMFNLYQLDGNKISLLGTIDTLRAWDEEDNTCFVMEPLDTWPAIEGTICSVDLVDTSNSQFLYNVPIQMVNRTNLRISSVRSYDDESGQWVDQFEALGLWEGYDEDTRMPSRTITSLYRVSGQEFRLLYPCYSLDGEPDGKYTSSNPLTMYRAMEIDEVPLPVGTYYCNFTVRDIFGHHAHTALIGLTWDGQTFSVVSPQDGDASALPRGRDHLN